MKMATDKRAISSFGTSEKTAFTIAGTAKAFKILSDGLYSDKIMAVIRELACNAYDSHVEAGKRDVPFEVHLPNRLEPWFAMTDFGIGLSHENILHLYSTYFESTKTDSNEVTGCLGLGSKSPFAYVDAFTVEGRWNGKLTTYSCYYDEEGIPTIIVLGEPADTDLPNGLTVKMPVKDGDFREFADKAKRALNRFVPTPTVTGNTDYVIEPVEYEFEGTDWKMYKAESRYYSHDVNAIQGNVTYPIDTDSLTNLTQGQRAVLELPLDLFFNIGDLDITPSRESLGYNKSTIDNIKAKLDIVAAELPPMFKDRLDGCNTLWDARKAFKNLINGLPRGIRSVLSDKNIGLKWKGEALDEDFVFTREDFDATIVMFERHKSRAKTIDSDYQGRFKFTADDSVLFFYDDLGHGSHSRMAHFAEDNSDAAYKNFLIKTDNKKALKKFSKLLGRVTVQPVSNLAKRPKAERATARVTSKVLEYIGKAHDRRDSWNPTEVDLHNGEGVYVTINRYKVYDGATEMNSFTSLVELAKENDLLDLDDKPIYGIRSGDVAKLGDNTKWTNLFDLIRNNIRDVVAKENIGDVLADLAEFQGFSFDLSSFEDLLLTEPFEPDSVMTEFLDAYKFMKSRKSERARVIESVASEVKYSITSAKPTHKLKPLWDAVIAKYPLIKLLDERAMRGGYYSNDRKTAKESMEKVMAYIRMVDAQPITSITVTV